MLNKSYFRSGETKQVGCIKWGSFYGADYVNILYGMVARNITGPFEMFCFTDDTRGIRKEVVCLPIPELGCEIPAGVPGKWKKTALWGKDLSGVTGTILFIDLDSIIVGNLDGYFTYGEPSDVITARNWLKPLKRMAQTTVFRIEVGRHSYMLDNLRADPVGIARKYRWEQNYVTNCVRGGFKTWPEKWTRHFRQHCMRPWPLCYYLPPAIPHGARIIAFPGLPNPAEIARGIWTAGDDERRTPLEHIRHAIKNGRVGSKKTWDDIRHYIVPAPWVNEHWRAD